MSKVAFVILLFFCFCKNFASTLFYLNFPESVLKPGLLSSFEIKKAQNFRVFFHFVNHTNRDQIFHVECGKIKNLKIGVGINHIPGEAGAEAVTKFFKSKIPDTSLNLNYPLKQNQTISGIIDGTACDTYNFKTWLGINEKTFEFKITTSENTDEIIKVDVDKNFQTKIGTKRKNLIDGDYGTIFKFEIKNKNDIARKIKIVVSPRGGDVKLAYTINEEVRITKNLKAQRVYNIEILKIKPHSTIFFTISPPGGYAYPLSCIIKPE